MSFSNGFPFEGGIMEGFDSDMEKFNKNMETLSEGMERGMGSFNRNMQAFGWGLDREMSNLGDKMSTLGREMSTLNRNVFPGKRNRVPVQGNDIGADGSVRYVNSSFDGIRVVGTDLTGDKDKSASRAGSSAVQAEVLSASRPGVIPNTELSERVDHGSEPSGSSTLTEKRNIKSPRCSEDTRATMDTDTSHDGSSSGTLTPDLDTFVQVESDGSRIEGEHSAHGVGGPKEDEWEFV